MKLFDFLFEKASLLVVALVSFVSGAVICFLTLFVIAITFLTFHFEIFLYVSLFSGVVFSLLFINMVYESRKSEIFYNYYDKVVEMVDNVKTIDELENIFDNEVKILRGLSRGGSHTQKITYVLGLIHGKTLVL
jgi:hypothetical protein